MSEGLTAEQKKSTPGDGGGLDRGKHGAQWSSKYRMTTLNLSVVVPF
jgi:hypothetical protein